MCGWFPFSFARQASIRSLACDQPALGMYCHWFAWLTRPLTPYPFCHPLTPFSTPFRVFAQHAGSCFFPSFSEPIVGCCARGLLFEFMGLPGVCVIDACESSPCKGDGARCYPTGPGMPLPRRAYCSGCCAFCSRHSFPYEPCSRSPNSSPSFSLHA